MVDLFAVRKINGMILKIEYLIVNLRVISQYSDTGALFVDIGID